MRLGCGATAADINPVAWFSPQGAFLWGRPDARLVLYCRVHDIGDTRTRFAQVFQCKTRSFLSIPPGSIVCGSPSLAVTDGYSFHRSFSI